MYRHLAETPTTIAWRLRLYVPETPRVPGEVPEEAMRKYRFGDFELDCEAVQLSRSGEPVKLERRPIDLLILLVGRQGQLLPREEIITTLWPTRVIIDFDGALNTIIRKVRKALDDSPDEPRFIQTVSGRGYRFMGDVSVVTEPDPIDVTTEPPRTETHRRRRAAVAFGLLLLTVVAIGAWIAANREPPLTRIAVLPFENLTGRGELGYLASGLAEETSASLAQIDLANLRVIGDVSTRAVADSARPLRQIGRDLGVDYLISSSLRLDAPLIRVTSRLIRAADGEQIWSASFDRELTNVLGLQRELSIAIAEQVRQRLSPDVAAAIDRRQTANPEAYALYLKGRYEWGQIVPSANRRALEYYEQAVEKDAGYALAWAGIAHLLATSTATIDAPPDLVSERAREALERAMRIDPDLAEVQIAKGYIASMLDADYPAAEEAARRAIALDPNNALAHMLLGVLLSGQGRHVEAVSVMRRARELDPLFALLFANSSMIAWHAGDLESALELAKQAIAIDPRNWAGHYHLGYSYLALGDFASAADAFGAAERMSDGNPVPLSARGYALARSGRPDAARAILADLLSRHAQGGHVKLEVAALHAGLGELDSALDWVEAALTANETRVSWLHNELTIAPLRADPRYEALLRRCESGCGGEVLQKTPRQSVGD